MGLERPNWFATGGMEAKTEYSFGRQNWFEVSGTEHRAARESVELYGTRSSYCFAQKGFEVTRSPILAEGGRFDSAFRLQ